MIKNILDKDRLVFQWRYFMGQTPWDTNVTPPEVHEFIKSTSAGKALDLGCGTGTNAMTLAQNGWTVTGVDFSSKAIRRAKKKSRQAGLAIDFFTADVTALEMLTDPYDYVLDIGCLFTLSPKKKINYATTLNRLTRPKSCYMLYAWLPRDWKGKSWGMTPGAVDQLLLPEFKKIKVVLGEEKGFGSAWYWYEKQDI